MRVYDDVPPVDAHRPSTVMVSSAVPVQAAGSRRPEPGNSGASVAVVAMEPRGVSDALLSEPDEAGGSAVVGAALPVVVAGEPDGAADPPDGAAESVDGVDDDAGLCPVTWISPHTTTTEHTRATTMMIVTHRVFRELKVATRPVCAGRRRTSAPAGDSHPGEKTIGDVSLISTWNHAATQAEWWRKIKV